LKGENFLNATMGLNHFSNYISSDQGLIYWKKSETIPKKKVQNGETLPKLNIGIYLKFSQYYRQETVM
jgi:hypothetical protein